MFHPGTLVLIMVAAVLAPLLAEGVARRIRVPLVIFEIALGILIGPDVLGWAHPDEVVDTLADLGLAMLIFLAGYEIEFAAVRGATLRRAAWSWLVSLGLGIGLAFWISGGETYRAFVIGTALTSTALGTVLPILRDRGALRGRFGTVVSAFGAVGEFGPVVAMALLLSGRRPGESAALLIAFGLITAGTVWWALRPRRPWFARLIDTTLHSSGQFAVRFVMLLLVGMLALAEVFGLDILLGAFAAGILTRLVLHGASPGHSAEILGRVEALGFGFLVPLFYVVTGIEFDLRALLDGGRALILLPVFLLLFLLVRGGPVYVLAPRDLGPGDRRALTLFAATCLPLVVAITTIGVDQKVLGSDEAASLVGAAMLSVLLLPLLAMRLRTRGDREEPASMSSTESEAW
ncbi:Kef-type K+ transport system membrane component KefB [Streptomyces sp. SAI-117]|uniref:cation:proton antiporter n=1 Tax=unclassified Streptomyces TaxID=2593676 RepID=UPI0024756EFC|nr:MULTISPECIES: cation:proton antiporter [unclassified Streptomyces]MDH6553732.1 Kef-type K+ transport system membrane component KefB [Streptomyces sp. SAI-041]MDH6572811.1 Kef-type K+ transport system membrane component KefB [Streptomyces sp. SAI-117]MDH6582227.1 Kef-type K+ transport system membrane component KefB [Streptomyces sp. SAI-133]